MISERLKSSIAISAADAAIGSALSITGRIPAVQCVVFHRISPYNEVFQFSVFLVATDLYACLLQVHTSFQFTIFIIPDLCQIVTIKNTVIP